ncbi:MAG: hypothetical protein ACRDVL_03550 [Acidimicrobiia bacterium]
MEWSRPRDVERRYNVAVTFKRALEREEQADWDWSTCWPCTGSTWVLGLLPIGAFRWDWRQMLLSDGSVIVRNPDLATTLEMADRFGADLQISAG